MKLSEMNTAQFAECVCELASPLSAIAQDDNVFKVIEEIMNVDTKKPVIAVFGQIISVLVPVLLKEHRDDLFAVLSALTGKSVSKITKQNALETIKEAKECIDKDFLDFFISSASAKRTE